MQLPPVEVWTAWPHPNYVNPETGGTYNTIITLILLPISIVIIGLRSFTRLRISKNFGLDDGLIVAALVPAIGFGVSNVVLAYDLHWNRHSWDMPLPEVVKGLKLILAMEIMFIVAAGITKLSMLALTYRIMTGSNKELRFLIKLVTVFVLAVLVGFSFADLFQCRPISDFWFLTFNDQPTCFKDGPLLLAGGILNTITDFLVVTLPIPTVLSLQLPRRQKVIIAVLLSVGFMVTITGAVRAYFTYKSTKTYDRVWALQQAFVCTSVELYVGIICACVPSLKMFVKRYLPTLLHSTSTERSNNSANPRFSSYQLSSTATTVTAPGLQSDSKTGRKPPYKALVDPEEDIGLYRKVAFETTTSLNRSVQSHGTLHSDVTATERDQDENSQLRSSYQKSTNS